MVVADAALAHQADHLFEVQQFLPRQLAQVVEQFRAVHVAEHQVQRRGRRLLSAVRVVDQQQRLVVLQRPADPRLRCPGG